VATIFVVFVVFLTASTKWQLRWRWYDGPGEHRHRATRAMGDMPHAGPRQRRSHAGHGFRQTTRVVRALSPHGAALPDMHDVFNSLVGAAGVRADRVPRLGLSGVYGLT